MLTLVLLKKNNTCHIFHVIIILVELVKISFAFSYRFSLLQLVHRDTDTTR